MRLRFNDRGRQLLVGIGVALIFVLLATIVIQQLQYAQTTSRYHDSSIRKSNEILAALALGKAEINEIKNAQTEAQALQSQLSTLVDQIHSEVPQITGALVNGQNTLIAEYNQIIVKLNALCAETHSCGQTPPAPLNPIPMPKASTTTTTVVPSHPTTTTTTTRPKHHHH